MIVDTPSLLVDVLARETGWEVKPQGACRGEECVPLPPGALSPDEVVERSRPRPVEEAQGAAAFALGQHLEGDGLSPGRRRRARTGRSRRTPRRGRRGRAASTPAS